MVWPPQSPDLNPIEVLCDELDRKDEAKQPSSASHMWTLRLQERENELTEQYLTSAIELALLFSLLQDSTVMNHRFDQFSSHSKS